MVIFYRGGWSCGLWCSDGHVLHLRVHAFHIAFVGSVDPFLGCLLDFVLDLPFGDLGFAASSDVLNISHDYVHGRGLTVVRGGLIIDAQLLVSPRSVGGSGSERFTGSWVGVLVRGSLWGRELCGSF